MKQARVSELKARLSAYLADVRNGETVLVCDRRTPIARLVPVGERGHDLRAPAPPIGPPPPGELGILGPRQRVSISHESSL